jgi:hypothetical protein
VTEPAGAIDAPMHEAANAYVQKAK